MRQGVYKTLKHMEADFILMTDNAKRYNAPKSVIYKDACKLKLLAKETAKNLLASSKSLSGNNNDYGDATHVAKRARLVDELVDLTQNEFNKKLLEAEAEAEAAAAANAATSTSKTKKGYFYSRRCKI